MKLILCLECQDVVKLYYDTRKCRCGSCGGRYDTNLAATVWGESVVVLGFSNPSLADAIRAQERFGDLEVPMGHPAYGPDQVKGREFTAFIIPESAASVRRLKEEPEE